MYYIWCFQPVSGAPEQKKTWAGDQLHKDTAGSLELIRMHLPKKKGEKSRENGRKSGGGKSGIPAIMLSMCCYFAFLARISLDPKSEWDLSPNNRWTKILECVWNCIKKSFSFCGGFHGVFPWFSLVFTAFARLCGSNSNELFEPECFSRCIFLGVRA